MAIEMPIRLSKAFGSTPETWLGMQLAYDLWQVRDRAGADQGRALRPGLSVGPLSQNQLLSREKRLRMDDRMAVIHYSFNSAGVYPWIEMWPESHIEHLLSSRPALIAEFKLR